MIYHFKMTDRDIHTIETTTSLIENQVMVGPSDCYSLMDYITGCVEFSVEVKIRLLEYITQHPYYLMESPNHMSRLKSDLLKKLNSLL